MDRRQVVGGLASVLTTLFSGCGGDSAISSSVAPTPTPAPAPTPAVIGPPPLPLASGAKVVGLGHSFLQRGTYSRYNAIQTLSAGLQGSTRTGFGYLYYVEAIDGRFNLDTFADGTLNDGRTPASATAVTGSQQGAAGEHLLENAAVTGTINRTPYVIARGPGIVLLDIGTNDIASGVGGGAVGNNSAADVIAALDRQIELLTAANIWVVIKTIAWRFDFPEGDARLATLRAVNTWIVAQSARSGVRVFDTINIDGTAATPRGVGTRAIIGPDNVHLTSYGAQTVALRLLPLLQSMVVPGDRRNLDPTDANMFPIAGLPGTGGINGIGVTGAVATGLTVTMVTGTSTAVASKEVARVGGEQQVLRIRPVADEIEIHALRLNTPDLAFSSLSVSEGDWLEVLVPVELDDWEGWVFYSNSGLAPVSLLMEQYSGTGSLIWETNLVTGVRGRSHILSCRVPVRTALGADRLRTSSRPLIIRFRSDAGGSGLIKIGSPILRRIADPRRAWNLA